MVVLVSLDSSLLAAAEAVQDKLEVMRHRVILVEMAEMVYQTQLLVRRSQELGVAEAEFIITHQALVGWGAAELVLDKVHLPHHPQQAQSILAQVVVVAVLGLKVLLAAQASSFFATLLHTHSLSEQA
jgi:hypothetical protein